jgi:uncharacterized protein with von Willebrand factor type A (vWA) domain
MKKLSLENINQQCFEMWDAINLIPENDPDRNHAIYEARETEKRLHEQYRKQEQLENAASELLEALQELLGEAKESHLESGSFESLRKAEAAIKKATE